MNTALRLFGGVLLRVLLALRTLALGFPTEVRAPELGAHSHFCLEVRGPDGVLKYASGWRHNLTTDSAVGPTNRRDWQAKAMGGGTAVNTSFVGAATATTATTLVNATASFPTAGQGLAGMMVAAGPNSSAGTGSTVWGTILSNTATTLTVDQWYNPGTLAVGTAPNATASYQILPGQAPAMWLALSTSAVAPAATDTTLASEITTNGFARALGTFAHTAAASTFTLQKVFTSTGGSTTINKEAVLGAQNGGVMPFESLEPDPPTLTSGDTVTQTVTVTI